MANSKYEYVRQFEQPDALLANTWIVVRIDGRGFSKFTSKYEFVKPNDKNGLDVMNAAALAVMKELPDLVLAFGNSDEYSFVFHKDCALFERRASKLTTTIVSTFTSYYVWSWSTYFPDKPLTPPLPSFDGRAVCYPSDSNLRDYMSWRQVDCHINNLYNTTFWTLLQQGGMGAREAEQRLKGTVSSDKNEILFKEFGINYNNEPECFKKGTVLYRDFFPTPPPIEEISSPVLADFATSPIAQPSPKRVSNHRASQSIERAIPYLPDQKEMIESPELCSRPTFLSTTSTPSPPPSPPTISRSAFPNPLRSNPIRSENNSPMPGSSMPLSPPSTATWNNNPSSNAKQHLPSLTPLPLSPPILKPSSKPPLSLNQPNPTTRTNFSPVTPQGDFPADYPIAGYRHHTNAAASHGFSHSASASLTASYPPQVKPSRLKQRSPSQPSLPTYFASSSTPAPPKPPSIPLRISSIPANSKPRKLSLPVHRSTTTLKATRDSFDEKESVVSPRETISTPPRKVSPPIQKNKALPSPPMSAEEEMRTREKVNRSSPQQEWNRYAIESTSGTESPQRRTSDSDNRGGHVWGQGNVSHPGIAELDSISTPTQSTPTSASLQYPHSSPDMHTLLSSTTTTGPSSQPYPNTHPLPTSRPSTSRNKDSTRPKPSKSNSSKAKPNKGKQPQTETGSRVAAATTQQASEGRPAPMSRTQKDKDRKKRSKATVLMEHVDIIKDEFWEKRPWILSGPPSSTTEFQQPRLRQRPPVPLFPSSSNTIPQLHNVTNMADLNSNNSFDSGASLMSNFNNGGFSMDSVSAFTAINDPSVAAGSTRTVSPKDIFNDGFGSAPPSTAFTNLTSPDIGDSPFINDSFECSPMFNGEPVISDANDWFSLFPEQETKVPETVYAPAISMPMDRTMSSQSMERSGSSSTGSPLVLDNYSRRKSSVTNSPATNGISKSRRRKGPLPSITVDPSDKIALKRARNTLAARESRQRKFDHVSTLEQRNSELEAEVEKWKSIAMAHGYSGQ